MANGENDANTKHGFQPVPEVRGRRGYWASVILLSVIASVVFTVIFCTDENSWIPKQGLCFSGQEMHRRKLFSVAMTVAVLYLTIFVGEMIRRACLLWEEWRHFHSRYQGDVMKMVMPTIGVSQGHHPFVFAVAMVIVLLVLAVTNFEQFVDRLTRLVPVILVNFTLPLLFHVSDFKTLSEVEIDEISERNNLNVAYGLAWSYYFGYLQIILPNLENTLRKSDKWGAMLDRGEILPKVFIIVTQTCYMEGKLNSDKHKNIEVEDPDDDVLSPLFQDRGGVQRRAYRNTVYTVRSKDGQKHYAIIEHATPLDTIYRMSKHSEAGLSQQDLDKQVKLFYRTLNDIIKKSEDCRGRCVLVKISGTGDQQHLSEVLLDAIKTAKK